MTNIYGGIDQGGEGWISLYDGSSITECWQIPRLKSKRVKINIDALNRIMTSIAVIGIHHLIIEELQPTHKSGKLQCFSMGCSHGVFLALLRAHMIPYETMKPLEWKKRMNIPSPGNVKDKDKERKRLSVEKCQSLLPEFNLLRTDRCKNLDHNKAESALMAVLAYRIHGGRNGVI